MTIKLMERMADEIKSLRARVAALEEKSAPKQETAPETEPKQPTQSKVEEMMARVFGVELIREEGGYKIFGPKQNEEGKCDCFLCASRRAKEAKRGQSEQPEAGKTQE